MSQRFSDRPYQSRTFERLRQAIGAGHRKILIVLPTGAGKGYLAARIMQMTSDKGNSSLFFAAQRELITQLGAQLDRMGVASNTIMAGVEQGFDSYESHSAGLLNTLIAKDTLWARAFRGQKMELPSAKMLHIDEAHASLSRTYQGIMERYPDEIIIGWTATPCRSDNRPLGTFYDTMIQAATYAELQADGHLLPVRVLAPSSPDLKGVGTSQGDYAKGSLQERMNKDQMVGDIINEWRRNAEDRSTVCFASGVAHSIHIRDRFRAAGITCEHVDGTMPPDERDEIMAGARDGTIKVVTNYGVLHTGVDVPRWKVMICARPTKSFGLWRQMGGRIQRLFEGHDHCLLIDHSDNSKAFGYPDEDVEWEIDGDIAKNHMEKRKKKKEEPKGADRHCGKCGHTYQRLPACPKCGFRDEVRPEEVDMQDGRLVELERKKINRKSTIVDKQKTWDECLGWVIGKNLKVGAAAHRYKDKYGCFPPNQLMNVPRSAEWKMKGRDFYNEVVLPAKRAAAEIVVDPAPDNQQEFSF